MSYEAVLEQVKTVPEIYLDEISNYINYVLYRYEKQTSTERFNAVCAEAQLWAKEVGLTEQDVKDAIKEVRAEKRRA